MDKIASAKWEAQPVTVKKNAESMLKVSLSLASVKQTKWKLTVFFFRFLPAEEPKNAYRVSKY